MILYFSFFLLYLFFKNKIADFIFQTNYTTTFAEQTIESHVGFIELPENEHESYFKFNIIGYSLLKDVQVGVVFVEGGQAGSRTNAVRIIIANMFSLKDFDSKVI